MPFYRLYNSNTIDHFYTTSITEKDNAVNLYNYEYNWVAAYVLTNNAPQTCSSQGGTICTSTQTCSGSWLDASDTSRCCSGVCQTQTQHQADTNQDGSVDVYELVDYIGEWKTGSVSISELMEAISLWKDGCN